jgi:hypothetical protein
MKSLPIRYLLGLTVVLAFGPLAFGQNKKTCVMAAPQGICGPYDYPQVTGNNGYDVNVQNGFWNWQNAAPTSSQTLYSTDPGSWYVKANFPIGNTAIMTYPNSDAIYNNTNPLLDSYTYIYGSYSENMHPKHGTDAEAAWDIWLNNYSNEVMIWNNVVNRGEWAGCQPFSNLLATQQFGGSNGVPMQTYYLFRCGSSELVWQLAGTGPGQGTGITSGSTDIFNMLIYLEDHGFLPAGTFFNQIEYGFEVASTGSQDEKFEVDGWTITASHGGQGGS